MIEDHSNSDKDTNNLISHQDDNKFYFLSDVITIENDQGAKTMKISRMVN